MEEYPPDLFNSMENTLTGFKNEPNQYEDKGQPPPLPSASEQEKGKEKENGEGVSEADAFADMDIGFAFGEAQHEGGGVQTRSRYGEKETYNPYEKYGNNWLQQVANQLQEDLPVEKVSVCQGRGGKVAYLEGNTAVDLANNLFGWHRWSFLKKLRTISSDKDPKGNWKVICVCDGTLIVKDPSLGIMCVREDVGDGVGQGRNLEDAVDTAEKAAVTDAFKRCLRLFGAGAGGSVYKKSFRDPLIKGPIKNQ